MIAGEVVAELIHEIWIDPDEDGQTQETLVLAGQDGDGARRLMGTRAELITTYAAGSHYEAMTIYYRFWDWGTYSTEHDWDYEPYPDSWAERQKNGRRDA